MANTPSKAASMSPSSDAAAGTPPSTTKRGRGRQSKVYSELKQPTSKIKNSSSTTTSAASKKNKEKEKPWEPKPTIVCLTLPNRKRERDSDTDVDHESLHEDDTSSDEEEDGVEVKVKVEDDRKPSAVAANSESAPGLSADDIRRIPCDDVAGDTPGSATGTTTNNSAQKKRRRQTNWKDPINAALLMRAIERSSARKKAREEKLKRGAKSDRTPGSKRGKRAGGNTESDDYDSSDEILKLVPRSTLTRFKRIMAKNEAAVTGEIVGRSSTEIAARVVSTCKHEAPVSTVRKLYEEKGMLSRQELQFINDTIKIRETRENLVTRKELLWTIRNILKEKRQANGINHPNKTVHNKTKKQIGKTSCENHVDYLIRKGKLPRLGKAPGGKRGPRTNRDDYLLRIQSKWEKTNVRDYQQFRFYMLMDSVWEEQRSLNKPAQPFKALHPHFQINVDLVCLRATPDGIIQIVGEKGVGTGIKSKRLKRRSKKPPTKSEDGGEDNIGNPAPHEGAAQADEGGEVPEYYDPGDGSILVTAIRIGSSAGTSGPYLFLAKGTTMDDSSLTDAGLVNLHGAPTGSRVLMTPNGLLTDDVWTNTVAPALADAIRSLPVVLDHPDWWVVCTFDGLWGHLLSLYEDDMDAFVDNRIFLVKEQNADGSLHVDQTQNQSVASQYQVNVRPSLEVIRLGVFSQWCLLAACLSAYKDTTGCATVTEDNQDEDDEEDITGGGAAAWVSAFRAVNMHPFYRTPFATWLRSLHSQGTADCDLPFTKQFRFEAMPDLWKGMSIEHRHLYMMTCTSLEKQALRDTGTSMWSHKDLVQKLMEFAPLLLMPQMRVAYLAATQFPDVIVHDNHKDTDALLNHDPFASIVPLPPDQAMLYDQDVLGTDQYERDRDEEEEILQEEDMLEAAEAAPTVMVDESCMLKPPSLINAVKRSEADAKDRHVNRLKLFHHMTDYCSRTSNATLEPSNYVNVEVSRDQLSLLNPTMRECVTGSLREELQGLSSKRNIAMRRLHMVDANLSLYGALLGQREKESLRQAATERMTAQAAREAAKIQERRRREQREAGEREEERRLALIAQQEQESPMTSKPTCDELLWRIEQGGLSVVDKLRISDLKMLLQFHFEAPLRGHKTKPDFVYAVKQHLLMNPGDRHLHDL
jgi:hypothetical protein